MRKYQTLEQILEEYPGYRMWLLMDAKGNRFEYRKDQELLTGRFAFLGGWI